MGSLNPYTGAFEPASFAGVQGRYPVINATMIGESNLVFEPLDVCADKD